MVPSGVLGDAPAPRVAEDVLSEHLDVLYRMALRLSKGREADADKTLLDRARTQDSVERLLDGKAGGTSPRPPADRNR